MDTVERRRRARTILARMVQEASTALADLMADEADERAYPSGRTVAALGEYAGMLDDALNGREPSERGARAQKVRRAFGFTVAATRAARR